jgi:predicted permease
MKLAFRQLLKSPGFTAVAVLSLALGIGANTAVFSVTNAVLLARLPVKDPERLVIFNWLAEENVNPQSSNGWQVREPGSNQTTGTSFSIPTFEAFQQQTSTLADVFAFTPTGNLNVIAEGAAEIVSGTQLVSGNYHRGLGVAAAAGRGFTPDDDQLAAEPVAVISHSYWQRRFAGDPAAIGKAITVNGVPVTIVGVTAPAFKGALTVGEVVDLTLPLALEPRLFRSPEDNRRATRWWIRVMARLQPGVTADQARASLEGAFRATIHGTVSRRTIAGPPIVDPALVPLPQLRVAPGGHGLYEGRRNYERSLGFLTAVTGLVLLVACANVANLLLARGTARRREIAVRLALGASRARIVRQLLAESLLLASLGALAGMLFAGWGARALVALQPFGAARLQFDLSLDWQVLGFTTGIAMVTGIVFGLAPALRATRLDLTTEFQGGARTLGGGARSTLAKSLMVVQVALSLVLLVGAGLFVRTLRNLQNVDVGFNREQLLLFQVNARSAGATGPQALATYDRLRDRFSALPGVRRVSYARIAPLSQNNWNSSIVVPGYVPATFADNNARMNGVETGYLSTMEIPLLRGRDFTARDAAPDGPKVAIVDQAFAKKYFGSEDVIGRRFSTRPNLTSPDVEIVGLVRDTAYSDVKPSTRPVVLFTYAQLDPNSVGVANFVVRFAGTEVALTAALRTAAREVDATLPLTGFRTQEQQIDRLFTQERLFANLCTLFGLLALGLSAVGLYGLMSYAVLRRASEIGLRMALGAVPAQVLRMILRESLSLVAVGIALGLAGSYAASRLIASLLFGLSPTDPVTYGGGAFLLLVVALAAVCLPARRAAKINPLVALRAE